MSLVGPRPPTPDEVVRYEPWQLRRLQITPGITCLWQVSGRSEVAFVDWVRLDLRYAERRSPAYDLGLIVKTVPARDLGTRRLLIREATRRHVLTVSVEEFFHHGAFSRSLQRKHWDRLESRVERNVEDALALLAEHAATATFFVHGSTAERQPELVRRVLARGHEVASRGFEPLPIGAPRRAEFRDDLARTRAALERAGAGPIRGYRAPRWLRDGDEWILDVLADEGYAYDASVKPDPAPLRRRPRFLRAHERRHGAAGAKLWEFPVSTASVCGLRVAISGGNWLRQLPQSFVRSAVERWDRVESAPLVWYFNSWELDADAPTLPTRSRLDRNPPLPQPRPHAAAARRPPRALPLRLDRAGARAAAAGGAGPRDRADRPRAGAPAPGRCPAFEHAHPGRPDLRELQGLAYLRRTLLHVRDELAATPRCASSWSTTAAGTGRARRCRRSFGRRPRLRDRAARQEPRRRRRDPDRRRARAHRLVATIDADCSTTRCCCARCSRSRATPTW
jgi:polysaccharide deacetylase family protein (PEP-CTERM system associated)